MASRRLTLDSRAWPSRSGWKSLAAPWGSPGSPRFPLKGSFKGNIYIYVCIYIYTYYRDMDIDLSMGLDIDMDAASDMTWLFLQIEGSVLG